MEMSWKGTLRSLEASARRSERNSQRRQRELQKRQAQYAKMEALEQAAYEVDVYNNQVDVLLSVHKECGEDIDWSSFISRAEPVQPRLSNIAEIEALTREQTFAPGLFVRLFGLENRQRKKLKAMVELARQADNDRFTQETQDWRTEHSDWQQEYSLATRIIAGEAQAKLDAIERLDPFSDIAHLGTSIKFSVGTSGVIEATLNVHGSRVVPSEIKSLLQSGKLSTKQMPISKYNEFLQDYVCSCVMRVGRELLALLPDDIVIVTAVDALLNSTTGHVEDLPVLSVVFSGQTLSRLNVEAVDPSEAMKNFTHNMVFKKASGFAPVQRVEPPSPHRV
ncbi:hypothetical protein ALQ95_00077 [Pseudomonas syringae pv. ribicola]|uniref:Uncharacterized protein n=2 Tax=Pseudomonas TaxID=286 RepID=A0A3M2VIM1_PSESI|nr:hypothetical protein ALQ95_00077 [Pseudomonas syringae pv. ribicola]